MQHPSWPWWFAQPLKWINTCYKPHMEKVHWQITQSFLSGQGSSWGQSLKINRSQFFWCGSDEVGIEIMNNLQSLPKASESGHWDQRLGQGWEFSLSLAFIFHLSYILSVVIYWVPAMTWWQWLLPNARWSLDEQKRRQVRGAKNAINQAQNGRHAQDQSSSHHPTVAGLQKLLNNYLLNE